MQAVRVELLGLALGCLYCMFGLPWRQRVGSGGFFWGSLK